VSLLSISSIFLPLVYLLCFSKLTIQVDKGAHSEHVQ
jgi:hypothetical protein